MALSLPTPHDDDWPDAPEPLNARPRAIYVNRRYRWKQQRRIEGACPLCQRFDGCGHCYVPAPEIVPARPSLADRIAARFVMTDSGKYAEPQVEMFSPATRAIVIVMAAVLVWIIVWNGWVLVARGLDAIRYGAGA